VSTVWRRVVYFSKLLFESVEKKFSLGRDEGEQISSHPGRDLM